MTVLNHLQHRRILWLFFSGLFMGLSCVSGQQIELEEQDASIRIASLSALLSSIDSKVE